MGKGNATDRYVKLINSKVLPFIDYDELEKSYGTDMAYAKGVLNLLHESMVRAYGSDVLDETKGDNGFVVIPAIVQGSNKKLSLALLDIDLSSSGEHWGTAFLCRFGVVPQSGDDKEAQSKEWVSGIIPYTYCYTAKIPGDIHVDMGRLPKDIRSILSDFKSYDMKLAGDTLRLVGKSAPAQAHGEPAHEARNETRTPKKSTPER